MSDAILFYFDFSSPYGYLASQTIDALSQRTGKPVIWRPYLLGVAFKRTGQRPLLDQDLRGDYARLDMARSARRLGLPFHLPARFPFAALAASRAFYWIDTGDDVLATAFAKAVYRACYGEGADVTDVELLADIAASLGIDAAGLRAAVGAPEIKDRLRRETDAAVTAGVFGSPFFIYDDQPFWGHDRMAELEAWITQGGW